MASEMTVRSEAAPAAPWYRNATREQWKSFGSAYFGWALDIMDLMLFAMVIGHVGKDLGFGKDMAGEVASVTLVATAFGGLFFGFLADRIGRTRAMMLSIICYSVGAAACGLATSLGMLMFFRVLLGIGVGGEWSAGAALITETWPAQHRGKVMAWVQSAFPLGYAMAALIAAIVVPQFGWRWAFAYALIPAFLAVIIRLYVHEPEIWVQQKERPTFRHSMRTLFGTYRRNTIVSMSFTTAAMCGYWGLFTWIPTYLASSAAEGGAGLDVLKSTLWIVVMQVGAAVGCITFGYIADRIGRKAAFLLFFGASTVLIPLYANVSSQGTLLVMGAIVAFFSNGFFSGFAPTFAELYPTSIRATAQGFIYNTGLAISAVAPAIGGFVAASYGVAAALGVTASFFMVAACIVLFWLPETVGKELD